MEEIRRQISWARTYDLPLHEISPQEAQDRFPLIDLDGVLGAAYLDSDGYLDPSQLCHALANGGEPVASRFTTTLGLSASRPSADASAECAPIAGDIKTEVIVNCGGMFAAEIGRLAGVRVPLVPMSHQYVVTEPFLARSESPLPTLRDPDLLVYFRQEVDGLLMGGYERNPEPFTATAGRSTGSPPTSTANSSRRTGPGWRRSRPTRPAGAANGPISASAL